MSTNKVNICVACCCACAVWRSVVSYNKPSAHRKKVRKIYAFTKAYEECQQNCTHTCDMYVYVINTLLHMHLLKVNSKICSSFYDIYNVNSMFNCF